MEMKKLAEGLHALERKVLPFIKKGTSLSELVEKSKLSDVEVMRALQWLGNKKLVEMQSELREVVELDENGKKYIEHGLPEKRFAKAIETRELSAEKIKDAAKLDDSELNASIGLLKQKGMIAIRPGMIISLTEPGRNFLKKESLEEAFLKKIKPGKLSTGKLAPEEKFALDNLKKRKGIVKTGIEKNVVASLTELGEKVAKEKISEHMVDSVTTAILKSGAWKGKKFRRYDVSINVPQIYGGKRHFVNQAVAYAKRIWTDLGFKEMEGPMLNTSFWNFDALFTAQDHPVREMQDTFFIKNPAKGRLPDKKLVDSVRKSHESGVCGSTGWKYKWNDEEAKKNVLRTHTTVLSSRTIATLKKTDLPAKFFAVGRCFRNEAVDWKHLFEFHQSEGIVIDPNANFRHLLGYLKEFYKKMGYPNARFRPSHFPYTEPSVEIDVFNAEKKEWVEIGGAGIFRPEVVYPLLGIDVPVLAWGPGFDRMFMEFYEIKDMRDIYSNNMEQLRKMKYWTK